MRTNINRNTLINILAIRQDWIVVAANDGVRTVTHGSPFQGIYCRCWLALPRRVKGRR